MTAMRMFFLENTWFIFNVMVGNGWESKEIKIIEHVVEDFLVVVSYEIVSLLFIKLSF